MTIEAQLGQPLTPREEETLGHIAEGFTQRETAHRMGLTIPTVNQYMQQCKIKLGARNACHSVALYTFKFWTSLNVEAGGGSRGD